jgi:acetyl esterase/lipase
MFRDPIRRYVQRLRDAGVQTDAHEYEGMFHVFQMLMPWADDSRDVFRRMDHFIHNLTTDLPPPTTSLTRLLGIDPRDDPRD